MSEGTTGRNAMTDNTTNWKDIWISIQELGAALAPVLNCKGAPPEWAIRLADALHEADEQCQEQIYD